MDPDRVTPDNALPGQGVAGEHDALAADAAKQSQRLLAVEFNGGAGAVVARLWVRHGRALWAGWV
jgi:hypothetical protein